MGRSRVYFVSDVHLGLNLKDPEGREARFVSWLKAIPREETQALYLLGDIWDFWYEYRDVVPREGARVVAQLIDLMDNGVKVFFFEGNHDMWSFSYFESLGMVKLHQPAFVEIGGETFCLGHGDGLGYTKKSYAFMLKVFHNRTAQALFSLLHPWLAYRFGLGWSNSNRRTHEPYHFRGADEPLYKYAESICAERHVDCFVFGHYHDSVDLQLPSGARLFVLKDWMDGGAPCLMAETLTSGLRFQVFLP